MEIRTAAYSHILRDVTQIMKDKKLNRVVGGISVTVISNLISLKYEEFKSPSQFEKQNKTKQTPESDEVHGGVLRTFVCGIWKCQYGYLLSTVLPYLNN